MISLSEVLAKMEKNLTDLEWEFSWIELGNHWGDTVDDLDRMTEILRKTHKLHELWMDSIEGGQ